MKRNYQRIFVHNLNYSESEQSIQSYFEKVGKIIQIKMPRDPKNKTKGFALITYEKAEDAQLAIQRFHNTDFKGKKICVEYDILNESEKGIQQTLEDINETLLYFKDREVDIPNKQSDFQWKDKVLDAASKFAGNLIIRYLGSMI